MINQIFNSGVSEQTAIITETGKMVTYSALSDDIKHAASSLKDRDLIFIICRNDYVSLLFYLAALEVGAVPLLLNAENQAPHLSQLLELYSPKFVLAAPALVDSQVKLCPLSQHDDYILYRNDASTCP